MGDRSVPTDHTVAVDQHRPLRAEAGQHGAAAQDLSCCAAVTTSANVRSGEPTTSANSSRLGLSSATLAWAAARRLGPLVSTATRTPAATNDRHSWGNAGSGRPGGELPQATTHSAPTAAATSRVVTSSNSAGVSTGPGSLIFVTVPSGSARVRLERVSPGDRDRDRVDPLRPQQAHQLLPAVAPVRQDRPGGDTVGEQCPGHVDSLAAGVHLGTGGADDLSA